MQLNPRKPAIRHEPSSIDELPNDRIDIRLRHFPRCRERENPSQLIEVPIAELEPNRTGRNRLREDASATGRARRLATRMAELDDAWSAVFLTRIGVFPPLVHQSFVLLLVGVFGGHRDVERGAEMVHVDLDIPCDFGLSSARRLAVRGLKARTGKNRAPSSLGPLVVCLHQGGGRRVLAPSGHQLGHCGLELLADGLQQRLVCDSRQLLTLARRLGKTRPQGSLTGSPNEDGIGAK